MSERAPNLPEDPGLEDAEDFFEHAPVAYLSIRSDGSILRSNATLASWSGFTQADLVTKRFPDLLTVGTRIFYETNVLPLLSVNGRFDEVALELRTASAGPLPVFAHAVLPRGRDGRPKPIRLVLTKAHERRRYERELVDARAQARASEASTRTLLDGERETAVLREQFIAVLGHDLRNPLASISGGVHLLRKDQTADRRRIILEALEGSISRMSGLIDNVLDFARGRLGAGIPLDLRPDVPLTPLLEQVVSELRLGAPSRSIETNFAVTSSIRCDPSRIGQLVSNLLGNAITHGAPGESIRIHADDTGDLLTLWVANGGPPIPQLAMERLFQPFFRGEVRNSLQGLGLGLHIASEIARAHGGTLTVTSSDEETRFTFQMPVVHLG